MSKLSHVVMIFCKMLLLVATVYNKPSLKETVIKPADTDFFIKYQNHIARRLSQFQVKPVDSINRFVNYEMVLV